RSPRRREGSPLHLLGHQHHRLRRHGRRPRRRLGLGLQHLQNARSVDPVGWLIAYGAVVRREVLVYLRRKQIFGAVLFLSLILLCALLLSWPDESYGWWAAQSLSYA